MKKIYSSATLHVINMHAADIITSSLQSFSVKNTGLPDNSINGFQSGYELKDANDPDIMW